MWIAQGHFLQLQVDLVIVTAIDHHHLKLMVLLRQQERKGIFDEVVGVFTGHYNDRDGRWYSLRRDAAIVAETGQAAINTQIIIELDKEENE